MVLLGWVTIERKQAYQIRAFQDLGYDVSVLTSDRFGDSKKNIAKIGKYCGLVKLEKAFLSRFVQIFRLFLRDRRRMTACIVAPAGRFAFIYCVLCKLSGIPLIVVEWGSIGDWKVLPRLTKFSMFLCYNLANIIWYKEPYMTKAISKLSGRPLYFLPNIVSNDDKVDKPRKTFLERKIDFIWVNRFVNRRYPEWLVDAAKSYSKERVKFVMLGLLQPKLADKIIRIKQEYAIVNKPDCMEILPYCDPYPYFYLSRFFVLASDVVFGNNALLEAMSLGVVPIVTNTEGVEDIVVNRENGIVVENSFEGIKQGIKEALATDPVKWECMSHASVQTVTNKFSYRRWFDSARDLIEQASVGGKGRSET